MEQDVLASPRSWRVLRDAWRWLGALLRKPGQLIERTEVIARIEEQGALTLSYGVLTALSCAIAILGLLLSSPAVVIGAMLISPLMGPIILFGFSLTILDQRLVLKSLGAIAVGTLLAVAQSALIVWLSPLKSATPEILSRTNPTLFDLLVAIFSAIAGAYAVVQHKGETIVGVAIATALMPPLAVIGYGLATWNWPIFLGAGGLFMTNLLAIGLTASLVAKFFGFGWRNAPHTTFLQTLSIFAVFGVLSIPLGISLERIASDALRTAQIRNAFERYFADNSGHIYSIDLSRSDGGPLAVDALVLVRKTDPAAENRLQETLARTLHQPVRLALSQVPMHSNALDDQKAIEELRQRLNAMPQRAPQESAERRPEEIAAMLTAIPLASISADPAARVLVLREGAPSGERLAALRSALGALGRRLPGWTVSLRIPPAELPAIAFAQGRTGLDDPARVLAQNIAWALRAGGVGAVKVLGHSDTQGRSAAANRQAALARASAVAEVLRSEGLDAAPVADYPVSGQARLEREEGRARFRTVTFAEAGG